MTYSQNNMSIVYRPVPSTESTRSGTWIGFAYHNRCKGDHRDRGSRDTLDEPRLGLSETGVNMRCSRVKESERDLSGVPFTHRACARYSMYAVALAISIQAMQVSAARINSLTVCINTRQLCPPTWGLIVDERILDTIVTQEKMTSRPVQIAFRVTTRSLVKVFYQRSSLLFSGPRTSPLGLKSKSP